ncbi:MAG: hypothetical protein FJW20_11670 [Acidimicrobiia bacterium]|nr:hypothetical protein [Acidimicrobiia bacterium]
MGRLGLLVLSVASLPAQGIWERRADYPISATEVSAAAIGGKIYALCGLIQGRSVNNLFLYDPRTDEWTEGAPAPVAGGLDHCNVAAAGGKLYLLGGIRIGSSFIDGGTYEYDPAANRWQTVGRMNVPRGASGVAAIGDKIYVAGGLAASGSVAAFEVFDTQTRQWAQLPNMPTARDHLTAQAIGGKFYALLGRAGREFTVNEEYDPAANAWRTRAPAPTARGGLGSGLIGGRIQVVGGEGNSGTPLGTFEQNEEYDPVSDTWRTLAPMPTPRHGLYGVTIDDRLFTPSGGPRAGGFFSSVHEVFYLVAEPPVIAGLTSAAADAPVAPGGLGSIFGARLSQGERVAVRLPLPVRMNAVEARLDGRAVPLFFTSGGQINLQIPFAVEAGPHDLSVSNAGSESRVIRVNVAAVAPAIFSLSQGGSGQGAVLVAGQLAGPGGRAARAGEVIEIYCTGLGAVDSPPRAGEAATGIVRTVQRPEVTIGGVRAEVVFAGLAPGLVGVYQVNVRVPANAPAGTAAAVVVETGAARSNTVTIAVAQ